MTVPKFAASKSLNDYLRETAGLKGTKVMCREAGCGCCAVAVTKVNPETSKLETYSVPSVGRSMGKTVLSRKKTLFAI